MPSSDYNSNGGEAQNPDLIFFAPGNLRMADFPLTGTDLMALTCGAAFGGAIVMPLPLSPVGGFLQLGSKLQLVVVVVVIHHQIDIFRKHKGVKEAPGIPEFPVIQYFDFQ